MQTQTEAEDNENNVEKNIYINNSLALNNKLKDKPQISAKAKAFYFFC